MGNKKEIIIGVFAFCLLIMLFTIYSTPMANAQLGTLKLTKGWEIVHTTDNDYFVWYADKNKQKTEICLLHKTANSITDLPQNKNVYFDKTMTKNQKLNRQSKNTQQTGLDKTYYGYCRVIDTETFLKFGEQSTSLIYQNESRIIYTCDNNYLDITLFKYENFSYVNKPEEIFVYNLPQMCKFGANDTQSVGLNPYKYNLKVGSYFMQVGDELWVENGDYYHKINFNDICLKDGASCDLEYVDYNEYNLYFNSYSEIDPIIQVIPKISVASSITSLDENKFIISRNNNGNITIGIFYTNGSVILDNKLITSGLGGNQKTYVTPINNTHFLLAYYNDLTGNLFFNIYNQLGNNLTNDKRITNIGGGGTGASDFIDFSMIYREPSMIYLSYIDDNTNGAYLSILNISNLNSISITNVTISSDVKPEAVNYNLIGCGFISNDILGCGYTDDNQDDQTFAYINVTNATMILNLDVDSSVGNDNLGIGNAFSNTFASLHHDSDGDPDIEFFIYNQTGNLINNQVLLANAGLPRLSLATTYSNEFNQNVFIASIYSSIDNNVYNYIINRTGTIFYNFTIPNISPSTPYISTYGQHSYTQKGFINDTFLIAFTNSTSITNVNTYYINGSLWNGIGLDYDNPFIQLIYPVNDTYTNGAINFTSNITDNYQLKNATLIIRNSTNSIVYQETQNINGLQKLLGIVYDIVTNGIFQWSFTAYDTSNNYYTAPYNKITYDTNSPILEYVEHTELNNSITIYNQIHVNVSVLDLSPTNTTIYLYNKTNGNYTLKQTYNSNNSIVRNIFQNLTNGEYAFNVSSCDAFNYCSNLPLRETFVTTVVTSDIDMIVTLSKYPYVELNETIDISVELSVGFYYITSAEINMTITELNNSQVTFTLYYNPITHKYENSIYFTELGDYPFVINAHIEDEIISANGVFKIRQPFYITIEGFVNTLEDEYINQFAYVTAELTGNKQYDSILEPFFAPITPQSIYGKPVWYSEYVDGVATLKLYEADEKYALRLIDGIITFESNYAIPNISKSYGTNTFIDIYTFDGNNETIKVLFTEKDLKPYRWLFNWILLIGLGMSIIIALFMLFLIPDKPVIALSFALLIAGGIILLRVFIFLWLGE